MSITAANCPSPADASLRGPGGPAARLFIGVKDNGSTWTDGDAGNRFVQATALSAFTMCVYKHQS